ncbi:OsmC family protein [Paenibacillus daejeonensis]|uniref:OsmC family protein n=1 Tax=Paenibacillus daejeonensis TaxID=135193 RepID=UPI000380894E|nr:OsmC family protein [Paenibacillus daejeonensis]
MTIIRTEEGQENIYNGAGLQVAGTRGPGLQGLSPRELLEASLGLCISISLQKVMDVDGVDYDKSELVVEVSSAKPADGGNYFDQFQVELTLPKQLDPGYKQHLLSVVEKTCTISNTLAHNAVVTTSEAK